MVVLGSKDGEGIDHRELPRRQGKREVDILGGCMRTNDAVQR